MGGEGGNMNDLIIILALAMIWPGFYLYRKYKSNKSEKVLILRKPMQREMNKFLDLIPIVNVEDHIIIGGSINDVSPDFYPEIHIWTIITWDDYFYGEGMKEVNDFLNQWSSLEKSEKTPLMDLPKELRL